MGNLAVIGVRVKKANGTAVSPLVEPLAAPEPVRRHEIVGPDGEPHEIACTDSEWISLQCHCRRYGELLEPHHPREHEPLEIDRRGLARAIVASVQPVSVPASGEALSVREYAKRWVARRRRDGLSSADENERDLRNHVLPAIGDEDVRRIDRKRLAALRDTWNARSALPREDAAFMASKTARNLWGVVAKMFADASDPDAGVSDPLDPSSDPLHVREDDPCAKIRPPLKRGERQQPTLWPHEAYALLTCALVPLHWRVLYAVALFLGLRQSELRALLCGDVDLDNLLVSITKKLSRKTGKVEKTKTGKVGYAPIERALVPLLTALKDGRDDAERLLWLAPEEDLAANVRKHLALAGVSRADLFADDETHEPFNFHGFRRTHLTWRAGRGDNATDLMGTVLHSDFLTTQGYIDVAVLNALRRQRERLFADLPGDLVSAAKGGASPAHTRALARAGKPRTPTGSGSDSNRLPLRPQRELNREEPPRSAEEALVRALTAATAAQRWDAVTELARALAARRETSP